MNKFNQTKFEETAIICLLLDKQQEYLKDTSKTFKDGIQFGYISTEAIFYYRCLKELKNGRTLHTGAQQTVDYCDKFVKYFGLEQIFNIDYIHENALTIIKEYEDKYNSNISSIDC